MAEDIKRTVWRLEGEAKGVVSELQKVKKGFMDSNTESKKLAEQTKQSSQTVTQQYKAQEGIVNKLRFSIRQLEQARDKSNSPELLKRYNALLDQQRLKLQGLTAVQKQVQVTGASTSLFGGAGGLSAIIGGAVGGFGVLGLVSALKQLSIASVQAAVDFEKSLSSLSSITGLKGEDLNFFKEAAQTLSVSEVNGVKVSASADELVRAFSLVGSSKPELLATKEALVEVTKEAIILSEASGLALPDAVKVLTASMNQFGAGADRTREFIDALAAGAKAGAAEIPEVGEAIVKFGVGAKQANISIQESVALIELFGEKGLQGSEAGTKLNAIITKISGARGLDKKALDSLKQFGVNLDVITDKSLPFEQRLKELSKIGKDTVAITNVFGLENVNSATTLLNNIERYKDLSIQIQETGVALDQATVNTTNAKATFAQLNNQFKEIKGTIGAGLIPALLDLTKALSAVLKGDFTASGLETIRAGFERLHTFTMILPSPINAVVRAFGEVRTAIGQFRNGQIFDGVLSGLRGVANLVSFGIFGTIRDRVMPGTKAIVSSMGEIEKAALFAGNVTDKELNAALKDLAASGKYTEKQLGELADTMKEKLITQTFIELSKALALTRTEFDELTKITDKYGISARITSEAIFGLKNATDAQLLSIFENQQGTIGANKKDFDDYIALIRGFKTKAEQEALDLNTPIENLTTGDKKKTKEFGDELDKLHKQLMKIIDDREVFALNQNNGIVAIERMNDFLRTQLNLQLSLQKAELERKGLLSGSADTDNALQKRFRTVFNQISDQSILLFEAEANKKIDDFNKVRLQKEKDLQFKMRQEQLINIQGDEQSIITAANERFEREKEQAIENAKVTGESIILVLADIEQRKQQELINIRRDFEGKELDAVLKDLDLREQTELGKIEEGAINAENKKFEIQKNFALQRLKLAKQTLDELFDLEEQTGGNANLTKQIEELQDKIQELENTLNKPIKGKGLQQVAKTLKDITTITDAVIDGIRQIMAAQQERTDFEIEQQQKRVDAATKLSEKGNAEILEQEQKRMDALLAERKKQVSAQKALDAIQFVSSSTVAIANAAAQGGGFASIATIAAVLGAIAGGIALVSSIAGSFEKGGYTGDGGKYEPAGIVHKGEFVSTKEKTKTSRKTLEAIHSGEFSDNEFTSFKEWKKRRNMTIDFDSMSLSKFSRRVMFPESKIQMFNSKVDVNGIHSRLDKLNKSIETIGSGVPVMNDKGIFTLAKKGEHKTKRIMNRP